MTPHFSASLRIYDPPYSLFKTLALSCTDRLAAAQATHALQPQCAQATHVSSPGRPPQTSPPPSARKGLGSQVPRSTWKGAWPEGPRVTSPGPLPSVLPAQFWAPSACRHPQTALLCFKPLEQTSECPGSVPGGGLRGGARQNFRPRPLAEKQALVAAWCFLMPKKSPKFCSLLRIPEDSVSYTDRASIWRGSVSKIYEYTHQGLRYWLILYKLLKCFSAQLVA